MQPRLDRAPAGSRRHQLHPRRAQPRSLLEFAPHVEVYGMRLDVAKVISMTSTKASCDVMPAQMNYEDSSGDLKILEYRTAGIGCRGQN
ncbi:DUF2790 domain-containing protein [Pseudomonas sp. R4-84]